MPPVSGSETGARTTGIRHAYDVIVVGGGPAGSTFAQYLRRSGHDVLVVEQSRHPRFCVGESLLPGSMHVWRELQLIERFERAGFLRKYGAYFCFEDGAQPEYFHFPSGSRVREPYAYEVPRAAFDALLWDAAVEAGADCIDRTRVLEVVFEGTRAVGVELRLANGEQQRVRARLVADCSGRSTLLGHQRGMRVRDRKLDKIALYSHYSDIIRSTGEDGGTIAIVATPFGWMWLIPFAQGGASVGAVMHQAWYRGRKQAGADRETIWAEVLEMVPAVSRRLLGAERTRPIEATSDFQYRTRELAGDGWVVVGDAGAFLDPVFSSGVHLAVTGARAAAHAAVRSLAQDRLPAGGDFARYVRRSRSVLQTYSKFIYAWYDPDFRAVFMRPPHGSRGAGFLKREIISVLAGFALPAWRVRPAIGVLLTLARLRRAGRRRTESRSTTPQGDSTPTHSVRSSREGA
jgi:flavin-dependent dehydrogenase